MAMMRDSTACPFCGMNSGGQYDMMIHIGMFHPEQESASTSVRLQSQYAECRIEGCEETLALAEDEHHVDLHTEEECERIIAVSHTQATADEEQSSNTTPTAGAQSVKPVASLPTPGNRKKAIQAWGHKVSIPIASRSEGLDSEKQLGKAELGKYAHEQHMPHWLVSLLHSGGAVTNDGVISVIEQLLQQSRSTEYAYLCHPAVQHVSKLKKEGGFCGYRNIQMLVSYINGANAYGKNRFHGRLPTIFEIQEQIEIAWDKGINAQGRLETGGITGTRKYIGTPEAQALFVSHEIPCTAQGFKDQEPGKSEAKMLMAVETYFKQGRYSQPSKVTCTTLPPIYFQHAGHSLTIVGFEKQKNGLLNLLVFDPMFRDPPALARLIGQTFKHKSAVADDSLKPYRRGPKYLCRYSEFEILRLDVSPPAPSQSNK